MTLFAVGCGFSPSGPPVETTLDPKMTANELATPAGTWEDEWQVVEGREMPIPDMRKDTIVGSGISLVRNG
ncbi:MAG: hypothetical protein JWO38_3438 [Gemmataceae bacterium]|nr:hypothetical protein [Gemmataceae bacterium]